MLHNCLVYLERYEEFTSPDQMKRVVNILHRIAVRLKTEGMFFKVRHSPDLVVLFGPLTSGCRFQSGFDPQPLQAHSRQPSHSPSRPSFQGASQPHQVPPSPVLQGGGEVCLHHRRSSLPQEQESVAGPLDLDQGRGLGRLGYGSGSIEGQEGTLLRTHDLFIAEMEG